MTTIQQRTADSAAVVAGAVRRLPALPATVSRLVQMSSDPEATAADLSAVIALDPAMLAAILKLANSAYYGCSRTVSDLEAAVVLLGFDTVRDLALSLNVIAAVEPAGPTAFSTRDFWKHSFTAGCLARGLCRRLYRVLPGEHFVAGFLHDIGRLVMQQADAAAMRKVVAGATAGRDPAALEREQFGCDHAEAGAAAIRRWSLPERIAVAVGAHHGAGLAADPAMAELELVQIVHVADLLANRAGMTFTARRSRQRLCGPVRTALARRGIWLRRPQLARLTARVIADVEATAQVLGLGKPGPEEE